MNLEPSVAELQKEHVVMELECIDRMYLKVGAMTESFVQSIMQFVFDHKIDLVRFQKGQRKDDVMGRNAPHLFTTLNHRRGGLN
jgi:hypothetical protein